jgi:Restriction endonuclease AspBHI N-terminal/Restriction endonuclease
MSSGKVVPFDELSSTDLVVDAVYQSGRKGNHSDDPISHIVKVSNQGGFRYRGSLDSLDLVALVSSLNDPDWPDTIDRESGTFIYFGDNKRPGRGLHETLRFGNELLRRFFEHAHSGSTDRNKVPPIFVFAKTGEWRDVRFIGLAVPGGADIENYDDLVAIWRTSKGLRFQNYRARFTILDVPSVSRAWLDGLAAGAESSDLAPAPWIEWREKGRYRPLKAVRAIEHRSRAEQLSGSPTDETMISAIHGYFQARPHDFERCAASLARMLIPDIVDIDVTRPSRDGGRDAIGRMKIGRGPSAVLVDFALEAKCYGIGNSVGVREMSRLISRLRHRQFGILVTTSFVDAQAYREIKEDQHPIVVLAAVDIVNVLRSHGYGDVAAVETWLHAEFGIGVA